MVRDGNTLYVIQCAYNRLVSFDIRNVKNGSIDPKHVTIVANEFKGASFNALNDVDKIENKLYFTDLVSTPKFVREMKKEGTFPEYFPEFPGPHPQDAHGIYEYDLKNGNIERIISIT
eukprot:UN00950